MTTFLRVVAAPVFALAIALAIGAAFLKLSGYPALPVFMKILRESFGDWYGFGQVLRTTTVLIFTGLAVAIGFHAGLFNIGVEGQLYMGAVALGIGGYYARQLPGETLDAFPWILWMTGGILLAALCGGLWATVPGVLKAYTGAHEVITTIMMNFIALAWINYLVRPEEGSFAVPATLHTPAIPQSLRMGRLSTLLPVFKGSTVNYSLFLAIGASVATYLVLRFSRIGFEIRAVGKNPLASRLGGISPRRTIIVAMFISGGLAGLVGVDFVLGYKGWFEEGFSAGLGFVGIAVALLANNHPIGVVFTAFLFGVLNYGKVAAAGEVPTDIIEIVQAAIIFAVVLSNQGLLWVLQHWEKRQTAGRAVSAAI